MSLQVNQEGYGDGMGHKSDRYVGAVVMLGVFGRGTDGAWLIIRIDA